MHLYNLPAFEVSQSVLDGVRAQKKHKNLQRLQSASFKDGVFYSCCITADDTFYVRKIDLDTGTIQDKQAKLEKGKIDAIFLCQQQVILKTNSNQIRYIPVRTIFSISPNLIATLQEKDFNHFYFSSTFGRCSGNTLKFLKIEEELIMVHLFECKIAFQNLTGNSHKKWVISAWDLGYGRKDEIIDMQLKNQPIFDSDSMKQLIIGVVKILQQNGDNVYVLLEMLWNQSKYVSSQIYVCHSNLTQKMNRSHILFTVFSSLVIVVYTGQHLLICSRLSKGIQVQLILSIDHQILDIVSIQSRSSKHELIAFCKYRDKTKVCLYNLNKIFDDLATQPTVINCDFPSKGEILGFVRLATLDPLLVCSDRTYILMPTILTLYQKIIAIYDEALPLSYQIEEQWFQQKNIDETQLQFLSFTSFYTICCKNGSEIGQAINDLFSAEQMGKLVTQFQDVLQKQIKCLKNDTSLCWSALQRQYTLVFIYLLKFLHFVEHQMTEDNPVIVISDFYLLQMQHAFSQFYSCKPLVEQQKIQSIIHRKLIDLKQNLASFLILFSKTRGDSAAQQINSSSYQYFQILKTLTIRQIIEFLVNKISLVDYLAFFIYQAALLGKSQLWKLGRALLRRLVEIRRDYPPLIGFLCGDIDNYTRSYHEIEFCKLLTLQQQKEEQVLQNLPSLKQTIVAAPNYLKKIGFMHLLCFIPDEYEKYKNEGNFLVLNIPSSCPIQIIQIIKSQIIQIRDKVYLFLTQENISIVTQNMESAVNINFCLQSRCEVYIFSQKLKMLNELFLLRLTKCFEEKHRFRSQQLRYRKQQYHYDFRCLSNQKYDKLIKAKNFSFRNRKFKICKKQESHEQISIVWIFYSSLLQLCETFNLQKVISHLKNNILNKSSINSIFENLTNLDISRISLEQKRDLQEQNPQFFYNLLFANMWNLYDSILQCQKINFIDFQEQLEFSSFSHSYLSILEFLSVLVEIGCIQQINREQLGEISLQRLKKIVLNKKGIKLKNKTSSLNQKIVLDSLRTELVLKVFRLTKQWVFDFQELLIEYILRQFKLSYKNKRALSYLIQINKQ